MSSVGASVRYFLRRDAERDDNPPFKQHFRAKAQKRVASKTGDIPKHGPSSPEGNKCSCCNLTHPFEARYDGDHNLVSHSQSPLLPRIHEPMRKDR